MILRPAGGGVPSFIRRNTGSAGRLIPRRGLASALVSGLIQRAWAVSPGR